jgi:Mitochondrial carrier protein
LSFIVFRVSCFCCVQNVQASYETKVVGSYLPELVRIARERGVIGLYSGLGPTLVRAFPANAALFLGVELGKRAFDKYIWKEKRIS